MFVKVKRSQVSFTYALEILHRYQRDIASLHRVALTSVTAREFWVRSPNGTWQFFVIRDDSVMEIQADGRYIPRESLPVWTGTCPVPADGTNDPLSPIGERESIPPFLHPPQESIPAGSIRARFGLCYPLAGVFFILYLQKTVHFYTLFSNTPFTCHSWQTGQYPSSYKTLMYAIGRQNEGGWIGSTVKEKEGLFLRAGFFRSDHLSTRNHQLSKEDLNSSKRETPPSFSLLYHRPIPILSRSSYCI